MRTADDNKDINQANALLDRLNAALASNPPLNAQVISDVQTLRQQVEQHCAKNEVAQAQSCIERAIAIIRTGAPVPE
jgi:hypothetical protein